MLTKSFGFLSVRRIRSHLALDMMGRAIVGTRNEAIGSSFTPAIYIVHERCNQCHVSSQVRSFPFGNVDVARVASVDALRWPR